MVLVAALGAVEVVACRADPPSRVIGAPESDYFPPHSTFGSTSCAGEGASPSFALPCSAWPRLPHLESWSQAAVLRRLHAGKSCGSLQVYAVQACLLRALQSLYRLSAGPSRVSDAALRLLPLQNFASSPSD